MDALSKVKIPETKSFGVSASPAPFGFAAAANRADSDVRSKVNAFTKNATIKAAESIDVSANSNTFTRTDAAGGAAGAAAIGAMISEITIGADGDDVVAEIGEGTVITARSLSLHADANDDAVADSTAAGGGIVAALGSQSTIESKLSTKAKIGEGANINVGSFVSITSKHNQDVNGFADSYAIAAASGSGAGLDNTVTGSANVDIGENASINAGSIRIAAVNKLTKSAEEETFVQKDQIVETGVGTLRRLYQYKGEDASLKLSQQSFVEPRWVDVTDTNPTPDHNALIKARANLKSGSGSLVGLTALSSDNDIGTTSKPFEAKVDIGNGATLVATGESGVTIDAETDINAADLVELESVSGFSISVGLSRVHTNANATINVDGATITGQSGDVTFGTRGASDVVADANLLVATALTGGAGAEATSNSQINNTINVNNSKIEGANVNLYAGRNTNGLRTLADVFSAANISAFSLLPSINAPNPQATLNENNTVQINGNSSIFGHEDISLVAIEGLGGDMRGGEDGSVVSLSLIPYGAPVSNSPTIESDNDVTIGSSAVLKAGVNASSVVLIRPVTDRASSGGLPNLPVDRIGTKLTATDKADLANDGFALPATVDYSYGELDLSKTSYTVTTGTVVEAVAGAFGKGTAGQKYEYVPTASASIQLDKEDYTNTARWKPVATADADTLVQSDSGLALQSRLNNKFYVIRPSDMPSPTLSLEDFGQLLIQQRDTIISWIASHSTDAEAVARYQIQLEQLEETMRELGLLSDETLFDETVAESFDSIFVNLPKINASPGSIFIEADEEHKAAVQGQKDTQLFASNEAKIQVVNNTPFALRVDELKITDNKRVVSINGRTVTQKPGNIYFNNTPVGSEAGDATSAPEISVVQRALEKDRYDATLDLDALSKLPQDLFVTGSVINENGAVTLRNFNGSINVSGELRGAPVSILAKDDFNLNTDGWFHTGFDPRQYAIDAFQNGVKPAVDIVGLTFYGPQFPDRADALRHSQRLMRMETIQPAITQRLPRRCKHCEIPFLLPRDPRHSLVRRRQPSPVRFLRWAISPSRQDS